jgi:precorrin isomerase
MDDVNIPSETPAAKIAILRAAAARCRRLVYATGDVDLGKTLTSLAAEYDAQIQALIDQADAGMSED